MKAQPTGSKRRGRRVLLGAVVVLAALEVLYLVAAHALLWTGQFERWGKSDTFLLEHGFSWTPWPGRVYVRELRIRHEDYNVQMELEVPRARVDIELAALAKQTFHARHVRASDVRVHFRHKVRTIEGKEGRIAAFAHIDGFADPPLYVGAQEPPLDDAHYNLWTVHLEDVDARVSELWMLEYRYRGSARAEGSFRLVPQRGFRLEPSTMQLDSGTLSVGPAEVASGVSGDIRCTVEQHDPRQVTGLQVLRSISTRLKLSLDVHDLAVADLYMSPSGPRLRDGAGRLSATVDVDHGRVGTRTRVEHVTSRATVHAGPISFSGATVLSFSVEAREGGNPVGKVALVSPEIQAASREVTIGSATEPRFELTTAHVDLADPLKVRGWAAKAERALVPNLRHLNGLVSPKARPFQGGAIGAVIDMRADDEGSTGVARIDVRAASVKVPDLTLTVSGSVDARWRSKDGSPKSGAVDDLRIHVDHATIEPSSGPKAEWWLVARANRFRWNGLSPGQFQGRFEIAGPSAKPLIRALSGGDFAADAAMMLTRFDDTHATVSVDRGKGALTVRLEHVESGDFAAKGLWKKVGSEECGAFLVSLGVGQIGVAHRQGEESFRPFATNAWLERRMRKPCSDV